MMKNASKPAAKKTAAKKPAATADHADDQLGKAPVGQDAGSTAGDDRQGSETVSEGVTVSTANPNPKAAADASGISAGTGEAAPVTAAPPASSPAGTLSTDNPPRAMTEGGAGHSPAGPAGGDIDLDQLLAGGVAGLAALGPNALDQLGKNLDTVEADFRKRFPKWSAAVDAWTAHNEETPSGLRITSKHEGFRRAGIAHSKRATEHPIETFSGPEQMEALFAEPNLTVELI